MKYNEGKNEIDLREEIVYQHFPWFQNPFKILQKKGSFKIPTKTDFKKILNVVF